MKALVSFTLKILGIGVIILGAHSCYVSFSTLEFYFGADGSKLFYIIAVPEILQDVVVWATMRGVQSVILPFLIVIGGFLIVKYSQR